MTRKIMPLLCMTFLMFVAGCGSSASDSTSGGGGGGDDDEGTVTLAITDAASDELSSFTVDLVGATFQRASGASTSVLTEPVDDLNLVELEEFADVFSVVELPVAVYVGLTLTFDWTDAMAMIIGETEAADIFDSEGDPLTGQTTMEVTFEEPFDLIAGRRAYLELDFNLDATVSVNAAANSVTVSPTIIVSIDPDDPKSLVLIGELVEVNTADSFYTMELKRPGGDAVKTVTCATDAATVFQIDGESYVGSAGLTAMDGLAAGTRVQCYGEHSTSSDEFDVSYVEAGLGTLGSSDIVEGHVIERVGNAGADPVLTVRGYSINEEGTQANFNTDFTVNLSFAETSVIQRASITDYDTDDINVGQAVRVYGSLSDDTMTANTADSVVRRIYTTVSGLANAVPAGDVLSMDVTRIGRHEIEIFNFDIGAVTQMDPDAMLADIGGLSTADVENDTPVQVRGFFESVDSTSATDFDASSLSNFDDVAYGMRILYLPASDDALVSSSTTSIVLDTTDAVISKLDKPFFGSIDIPEVPDFTIEGNTSALIEVYMLIEEGEVSIFSVFSEFSAELQDRFNDGKRILRVNGTGEYDDGSNTISSSFVIVRLKD